MKNSFSKTIFATCAFVLLLCSCKKENSNPYGSNSNPGINEVFMQASKFNPGSITISKGSSVTWTNKDNTNHTVTSNTNLFDSGSLSNGKTFSYKFTDAGTYSYYCKFHSGMTGTVIVQ